MFLFTLCLDPLLIALHDRLTAPWKGRESYRRALIAYVENITIILPSPNDAATRGDTQLRGGIWSITEHPQIQGNGLRFLEHCTKHNGDIISNGTAPTRYTHDPNHPPINWNQLGDSNGKNTTSGEVCVLQRSRLTTTDTTFAKLLDD
jgi:hypothetical protein